MCFVPISLRFQTFYSNLLIFSFLLSYYPPLFLFLSPSLPFSILAPLSLPLCPLFLFHSLYLSLFLSLSLSLSRSLSLPLPLSLPPLSLFLDRIKGFGQNSLRCMGG